MTSDRLEKLLHETLPPIYGFKTKKWIFNRTKIQFLRIQSLKMLF